MTIKSKIIAEGFYLPEKIVTNHDLALKIDTSHEWIFSRTGISCRHIAADGELTSDLATKAVEDMAATYNIDLNTIDGIMVATTTGDLVFPATSAIVQNKLGLSNSSFCFDISAVCSGFVYALSVADSLIKSGAARRIVVVGAEVMSKIVDWGDRNTCILFGDGAGCVLLESSTGTSGILGYNLFSNGKCNDILKVDGKPNGKITMNGREVFKNAVEKMSSSSQSLLSKLRYDTSEISWLIPHQANSRIMSAVATKLELPAGKLVSCIANHANTSAASIPLAYSQYVRDNKISKGQLVLFSALGAGLTWGSLLLKV